MSTVFALCCKQHTLVRCLFLCFCYTRECRVAESAVGAAASARILLMGCPSGATAAHGVGCTWTVLAPSTQIRSATAPHA